MEQFKEHIKAILKKELHEDIQLEMPDSELGDYAFPCFSLAKCLKKSPQHIASELASKLKPDSIIEKIEAAGPYVNFFINKKSMIEQTIKKVLKEKGRYGSSEEGKKQDIALEHTSVNPNASPHVGRARNAMIGDALARILKFQGHKVAVHYLVNDIGKQIAMLVLGAQERKDVTFKDLITIYMAISAKVEENPEKEKEALALLHKLEHRDEKIISEFKRVVDIAIRGQTSIMAELDINYDSFDYESRYLWNKRTEEVLAMLKKTARFFFDKDNRVVLDQKGYGLGMEMPFLVLTRGDGTSLYPLRDIAYALDMVEKGRYIVVLGEDHKLYNEQINVALKMLEKKTREAVHYSFVLLEDGKMSTRKGNVVLLEDFMIEAAQKAENELQNRYGRIDKESAKVIGYGALKFSILKVSPEKNVIFNWEHALSFEGETAPYVQYAYARIASILRKDTLPDDADLNLLNSKEEIELAKKIALFPEIAKKAAIELRPHIIANYVYDLAKMFNEFYHSHQVLKEKEALKNARLILIAGVQQTLKNSLALLGISVLEKM